MAAVGSRISCRSLVAALVLGVVTGGLGAQALPPVPVTLTPNTPFKKGVLGPTWDALRAQAPSGESFVLRQRVPAHPKRLLVYLDGGGAVGHDNYRQLRYPAMIAMFESEAFADTLVLLPQCPQTNTWDSLRWDRPDAPYTSDRPSALGEALVGLVSQLQATYGISREHSLVWGISLGAFGLLDVITWHPDVFGTAVSLAGGGDPTRLADTLGSTTLWLFHGDQDSNVPPAHSQRIADALAARGLPVRLTFLLGANHGILEPVLARPEFRRFLEDWAQGP